MRKADTKYPSWKKYYELGKERSEDRLFTDSTYISDSTYMNMPWDGDLGLSDDELPTLEELRALEAELKRGLN